MNFVQIKKRIETIDSAQMYEVLKDFSNQVIHANEIGKLSPTFKEKPESGDFLILGMGGSAIGGDILNSFLSYPEGTSKISIRVNRNYDIPRDVDANTNIIASSYSGNTEETLSALEQAAKITNRIVCITSGGKLEQIAKENDYPLIKIPAGYQPRCALGYSFFPLLHIINKSGLMSEHIMKHIDSCIIKAISMLKRKSLLYSEVNEDNLALQIAKKLIDSIIIIYSSVQKMDAIAVRWKCQINENAKALAFTSILPEMNHNEINSFSYPENLAKKCSLIFLNDVEDHPKIKVRFNALENILKDSVKNVINIESEKDCPLARIFNIIYLGDWVSYYLALLYNVDPTPIPLITELKNILSKS